jgi:geranylgeranyl reductase family protein
MSDADADGVWDLVVVGAGPAGAATALGALATDPGLRVLLLDRADFPRDKSCGDGIAPHVFDALASVGVHDLADGWAPLRRLELAQGRATVERSLARPVWVIPREVLDHRLAEHAARAGAVRRRHRVHAVQVRGDQVVIDDRIRARVVVGADGAHSVVRGATGRSPGSRQALAIRGYAPTTPRWQGRQLIVYGERRQPSYAWAFDRGDGLTNVGYGELLGTHQDGPSRALLLEQLEHLLPGAGATGGQWRAHHLPLSTWRLDLPTGRVLLAGDAAGLVNPMTGEGIYYAVATGILAGRAAARAVTRGAADLAGALHRRSVQRLLARHLRHTFVAARLSRVPTVVDAGIRAAAKDQRAFDDLVEIGLGQGLLTPRLANGLVTGLVTGLSSGLVTGARNRLSHEDDHPSTSTPAGTAERDR